MDFFGEAFQITEGKELTKLMNEIIVERNTLTAELDRWKGMVDSNISIYERIEQARLETYIKQAQKFVS